MKFRICTGCPIHHFENCPNCFGFGFRKDGSLVTIGEVVNGETLSHVKVDNTDSVACPVCKSTVKGLPEELEFPLEDYEFNSWDDDPGYF